MLDAKLCLQKVSKNVKTVTFKIFETRWREFFTKNFWQTFAALVYFSSHFWNTYFTKKFETFSSFFHLLRNKNTKLAGRHSSVVSSALTILWPRVRIKSTPSKLFK